MASRLTIALFVEYLNMSWEENGLVVVIHNVSPAPTLGMREYAVSAGDPGVVLIVSAKANFTPQVTKLSWAAV
mgnify:CR=1 FL=1